jgi:GNAT superfamily N-acetyltransferase
VASNHELTFRPASDEDLPFAVATIAADTPHHALSAGELVLIRDNISAEGAIRWFVAELGGRPVGWAVALMVTRDAAAGRGRARLYLPGAGADLWEAGWALAEDALRLLGARLASTMVWEDRAEVLESLRRRGWERKRRERYWRLDLCARRDRVLELRAAAGPRVEAHGVRLATAADLGGEAAAYPGLHQVALATEVDIPRSLPFTPDTYEVWLRWMRPPRVRADRVWVALADGRPVGYSFLAFNDHTVNTGYTGVLREYRGRGIARALKLETLAQAIELGVAAVGTDNDSENAPILHLNEALGYDEVPGQIDLHKDLA